MWPIFLREFTHCYLLQTLEIKQYKRIDIGGSFGNFANEVAFNPQQSQSECGTSTSYSYEYFKQVYQMAGVGYSQVTINNHNTTTSGINVSGGNIKSTNLGNNNTESEFIFAVNPFQLLYIPIRMSEIGIIKI